MKIKLRNIIATTFLAALTLVGGCSHDDVDFNNPGDLTTDPDIEEVGDGYLSLSNFNLVVDTTTSTKSSYPTADEDNFIITITHAVSDEVFFEGTYAEAKAAVYEQTGVNGIWLPVGSYELYAESIQKVDDNGDVIVWDNPQYSTKTKREFKIGANQTTTIDEQVVCTLANIKTSLSMSIDLMDVFSDEATDAEGNTHPLTTIFTYGTQSVTYVRGESRTAYFDVEEGVTSITVEMSGMYNMGTETRPNYVYIPWTQEIKNVDRGDWHNVSINISHYGDGQSHIECTVTSWSKNETLEVVTSKSFFILTEDEIYDPDDDVSDKNAPVVTLANDLKIEDTYYISPATFEYELESDEEDMGYAPYYTLVATPYEDSQVKSVKMFLSTTNEELAAKLLEKQYNLGVTIWDSEAGVTEDLSSYFAAVVDSEDTTDEDEEHDALMLSMTKECVEMLSENLGTHTVKLYTEDSSGRRAITVLTLKSVISDKLDIVWRGGYDFDTTYDISEDASVCPEVVLDITSLTGITNMRIKIISDTLTPEELETIKLAQEMDLINPATEEMEASLRNLGFPVGDDIEGHNELVFDITSFMPMLAMISPNGSTSDFVIMVEDASGECVKTLKVITKK